MKVWGQQPTVLLFIFPSHCMKKFLRNANSLVSSESRVWSVWPLWSMCPYIVLIGSSTCATNSKTRIHELTNLVQWLLHSSYQGRVCRQHRYISWIGSGTEIRWRMCACTTGVTSRIRQCCCCRWSDTHRGMDSQQAYLVLEPAEQELNFFGKELF